jgi:hypothetical protein
MLGDRLLLAVRLLPFGPGDITRDGAREEARRELRKAIYHAGEKSLPQRAYEWVLGKIGDFVDKVVRIAPGGLPSLLVVIVLIVGVIVAVRLGLGPTGLRDALTDRRRYAALRTAAEYRAEAEELAARAAYKEAVRARFRAVLRELEERGVLDPRPGRTAGEIAREGGAAVPAVAADLRAAAATFDSAWYGTRTAGATEYAAIRDADDRIRAARLTTAVVAAP